MGRFASACVRRARRSVGWWRWPWFGRMQQMKVIVLGTGAIGAYYGAQLARAGHAVTCFARGANLGTIQERGLEVRTPEGGRSEEHTSELQSRLHLVCRLLLEKKKKKTRKVIRVTTIRA